MFQMCIKDNNFPLAMVALLEDERWTENPSFQAVFLWFLTGAPSEAVINHGTPKLLTAAALDIAVCIALNGKADGRLWLHAAPAGGQTLMDWYAGRGLEPVSRNVILPGNRFVPRPNDGRYFQMNRKTATVISEKMDKLRF